MKLKDLQPGHHFRFTFGSGAKYTEEYGWLVTVKYAEPPSQTKNDPKILRLTGRTVIKDVARSPVQTTDKATQSEFDAWVDNMEKLLSEYRDSYNDSPEDDRWDWRDYC